MSHSGPSAPGWQVPGPRPEDSTAFIRNEATTGRTGVQSHQGGHEWTPQYPQPPSYPGVGPDASKAYVPVDPYLTEFHQTNTADVIVENGQPSPFSFDEPSIRKAFIRKVYAILMAQLLATVALMSIFAFSRPIKYWASTQGLYPLITATVIALITLIPMACFPNVRRKAPMNFIFLGIFTLAEGVCMGIVVACKDINEVITAVGITSAVCLALTLFAFQTKWDFTMMGGFLLCGLVTLLLFGICCSFYDSDGKLRLLYSCLGVLLFSFYIVYDTQVMLGGKHKYTISPEEYVFAALSLYLDVLNLFLHILRIVGGR